MLIERDLRKKKTSIAEGKQNRHGVKPLWESVKVCPEQESINRG